MWFKNLKVFRLTEDWSCTAESLATSLESEQFAPADSHAAVASGWVAPAPHDERLAYGVVGQILCSFRTEKKLLPASVVNQFVKARAQELEEQQGFKPGRKQMRDLKLEVTESLLPRAFSIQRDTKIWIDPVHHWLVIDTGSSTKAEEILSALGKVLYPFPVLPLQVKTSPATAMTEWVLQGEGPALLSIDQDAELKAGVDQGGAIRYVKHSLDLEEVQKHVRAGKQCTKLALTFHDRISFVLNEQLDLKRVAPLDILDQSDQVTSQDETEKFDSDFALMCAEYQQLLSYLAGELDEIRNQ